jgi:hypothetical protein
MENASVRSILRVLLVAFALVLAATALVACGDGSENDDASVDELLRKTFGESKDVESGKLNVAFNLDAEGLEGLDEPVTLRLSGPFASEGDGELPRFDLALTLGLSGQNITAGAVSTGDKGFLEFQGQSYAVTQEIYDSFKQGFEQAQKQAEKETKGEDSPTLSRLGVDPRRWLTGARKAGEQEVGGAETFHITADIDVRKLLDDVNKLLEQAGELGVPNAGDVPQSITDEQKRQIAEAVKEAKVDIFTGKDDTILRRLQLRIGLDVPESLRKEAGGLRTGTLAMTLEIADIGEDQEIKAPASSRPLEELLGQFGGTGGGLGGLGGSQEGSGSGSESGSGSGSGSGDDSGSGSGSGSVSPQQRQRFERYSKCLQDAGEDIAEAQKCAALLTP